MCDYIGDGRFVSILSGEETTVTVRKKTVDATWYNTRVPSTQTPKYRVAEGVRLVTPNALPQLWQSQAPRPAHFVIVGAGKTAMDVGVWLLNSGAPPEAISWVMPRDSWVVNRASTQPGMEFFKESMGGQAALMEACAQATSVDDLFERLEASDQMMRIDPQRKPTMFHYATLSRGEVDLLRRITQVIRMGRVQAIETDEMVLDQGRVPVAAHTLFIDCTASAVEPRPAQPIFQGDKLVLQIVRMPLPTFSAALVAYVEAHHDDDAVKNQLCATIAFPHAIEAYPACVLGNMMNQFKWGQDKALRQWLRSSRLDGFGKMIAGIDPADEEKMAIMARFKAGAMAAMGNLPKLVEAR
jgi:hypothetical protein